MYVSNPPPLHTPDPNLDGEAAVPTPVADPEPLTNQSTPPSSSFSTSDGFEAKMGDNGSINRRKEVQFVSISPLDRLLNQKNRDDEIRVSFSC